MKAKDKIAVRFFRKRIDKISPTLADKDKINKIIEDCTSDLSPNLKKLVQQRTGDTFKMLQQEYIKSNPQVAQLIEGGLRKRK